MDESENTFPMDLTDPSSRPWNFKPEGYLVVILADTEEAERAESALVAAGFDARDIRLYTGRQILDNHEEYMRRRGVTSKVVGSMADDQEGRELYLGYAREPSRCSRSSSGRTKASPSGTSPLVSSNAHSSPSASSASSRS